MGAKITTEIDPYIKQVFEGMKNILGLTYKDILEAGILAKIMDIDPVKAEEIQIMRLELELSAHKMHLATLKVRAENMKEKNAAAQKNAIEAKREAWFKTRAEEIAKGIDEGYIVWNNFVKNGYFTTVKEAKEWIMNHLSETHPHE